MQHVASFFLFLFFKIITLHIYPVHLNRDIREVVEVLILYKVDHSRA